jgi:putative ubiquitin-RnfH superfamily antitoxin RatB of RatAB toxin-antitoxin module
MSQDFVHIEIAYATPERQMILECEVGNDVSPRQAVIESKIDDFFPEIDKESCDIGIFGKAVRPDHKLENGDRIEIYRPLIADPKEVRKKRAQQGLKMKKGGGQEEATDSGSSPAS